MHSAHSVHSAHSAHSVHGMHSAHSVHSMHTAHSLHDMHSAHSMHSLADSNMGDAPVEDAAAWKLQVLGVSRSLGSWQAAQAFVWQLPEDTSHVDLSASGELEDGVHRMLIRCPVHVLLAPPKPMYLAP
jgi:hypothetical protein